MTDEEIEDMNFKAYLEARYYEALYADFDKAILMGAADLGDNDETQA